LPRWAGETPAQIPALLFFQLQNREKLLKMFTGTERLLLPFSIWDITGGFHTSQMES